MKFSFKHSLKNFPDLLIIPISKKGKTNPSFVAVSKITNVPAKMIESEFKSDLKESHTLYYKEGNSNKRIVLLGLGKEPGIQETISAFRSFFHKRKSDIAYSVGISFMHANAHSSKIPMLVEAAANGAALGKYEIGLYKTKQKASSKKTVIVSFWVDKKHLEVAKRSLDKGQKTAATQLELFDLVNAPSNKKTPQTLAKWATRSGKKHGYNVKVLNKKEIYSLGLHALLAVNRGSEDPSTFIIMEYKPKSKAIKKIGLVGKGVTFDTGGLSIKPSTNMHYMKSDMGGAAAVMGTIEMVAKLKLPIHIMAVVPATDNSVDAKSIKPGDVINSYDGKTIEVIDTDAEGRLILADGLAYVAKNFKPQILIDMATLTGSCIRALGPYAGGLFSNNKKLAKELMDASSKSGERLWQFPIWDDYEKELISDVADIKNYSGRPTAGAITAAKFLEAFIQDHQEWAHMDIAGVAVSDSEYSSQKSATAFGVRLLIQYFSQLIQKEKI